ncbi:hypothetical protein ACO22_03516 [Paracoccidioides brasiliensis]|uniref:Uncharacterized protein n=1 Tax=Paracoccidioides brasiliensis TaxID=121759 RepID=A0A1D2JFQ5_PARBR|nr:hypothetical protein ACO22_03516 [Paracoccidioides brasiliensis]
MADQCLRRTTKPRTDLHPVSTALDQARGPRKQEALMCLLAESQSRAILSSSVPGILQDTYFRQRSPHKISRAMGGAAG